MKYDGIELSEEELVVMAMEDPLFWGKISYRGEFTFDEIKKYKDKIDWDFYKQKVNSNLYTEEEMIKIFEIIMNFDYLKDNQRAIIDMFSDVELPIEFIKRYGNKIPVSALVYGKHKYKLKASELIKFNIIEAPKVGDKATIRCGSDCHPYEIIEVSKSKLKIVLRELDHEPVEDFDYFNNQEYTYKSNENNYEITAKLTNKGYYKSQYGRIAIGKAKFYMDPSF